MESAEAATGIIGAGVISEGSQPQDWERLIGEGSEQLYRARLTRRFFRLWAYPGNAGLAVLAASCFVLLDSPSPWLLVPLAMVPIASIAVSAHFVYRQHFSVRKLETRLRDLRRTYREQLFEEFGSDRFASHRRYREQVPDVIDGCRFESRRQRRKYNVLQSVIIGGSIVTSAATAASLSSVDARWLAIAGSLLVAIAAAYAAHAKYRERSVTLQHTADSLEREYHSVELRVGQYRRFSDDREAYAEFSDRVEALRAEQSQRQQQLGQSAEASDVIGL